MFTQIELTTLLDWAVLPSNNADELFDEPEVNDALAWAKTLPLPEKNDVLTSLSARLPSLDAAKASALLVFGGSLVEDGASPVILLASGLEHLTRLRQLQDAGPPPAEAVWRFTVIGLMALLCRSAPGRALFKQQAETLAWLGANEDLSGHFDYLLRLAETSDEEVLWVLFPDQETGLEVSVSQVNNTFHLLTLLQPLVLAQAAALKLKKRPALASAELLRFAQGDHTASPEGTDRNLWEWLNALAYEGGPLNPAQFAAGDASVSSQPRVRGNVLLLATEREKYLQRSWDAGFLASLHDAHRPAVRLRRRLPAAEVRGLLVEMHPPVAPPAPAAAPPRSLWQRLWRK
ncbi:hypothetical protein [Hymenobacter sp.]|uniref:hypothetical protein n=1 Tax=Hymenobacter sp. TaxID=1898978 RepID=UPI00286C344C|nr:hypothetical protein [Hymenobacter sp.]